MRRVALSLAFVACLGAPVLACPDDSPICVLAKQNAVPEASLGISGNSEIHSLIANISARHGVPLNIAHAVIKVESGYRCNARSRSGARGIAQVLPATARSVGVHGNLYHCATSLEAGMRYLRLALDRGGNGCSGVSLYERGIYARPVCSGYGQKVMRFARRHP